MSFAVLSADAVTARMLQLEVKRCGFCEVAAEKARILLVDLDHPTKLPQKSVATLRIALCEEPTRLDAAKQAQYHAVLAMPFCVTELAALLQGKRTLATGEAEPLSLRKKTHFSGVEQALLDLLQEHRDRTVTIEELSTIIGQSAENSNAVAVYLYRLRRKLEADGHRRIRTVRGVGYRWLGD